MSRWSPRIVDQVPNLDGRSGWDRVQRRFRKWPMPRMRSRLRRSRTHPTLGENEFLRDRTSLILRTRGPTRPSPAATTTPILRGFLRREASKETGHRSPDLGLHQLTNDRYEAFPSRHPSPPCYEGLPYPRLYRFANVACLKAAALVCSIPQSRHDSGPAT